MISKPVFPMELAVKAVTQLLKQHTAADPKPRAWASAGCFCAALKSSRARCR